MLLAQNWDWYKDVVNCQVILKISRRDEKPAMVMIQPKQLPAEELRLLKWLTRLCLSTQNMLFSVSNL
jgi:hypothetical protein